MPDYRTMFDSDYLYAFHLQGKELTVEISRVTGGEVTGTGGKKSRKPVCYFKGKEKPLALNKTNCKTIAGMYGPDTAKWVGRCIAIYPTTTSFGNETVECIRVKPGVPRGKADSSPVPDIEPPASREPGAEG